MNKILLLTLLCFTITLSATAQERSTFRWKEVQRYDEQSKDISFEDTITIHTTDHKKFSLLRKGLFIETMIDNDVLNFGYNVFKVEKNSNDEIILFEEPYYHVFHRDLVNMEHADAPIYAERKKAPQDNVINFDFRSYQGKWTPYKKELNSGLNKTIDKKEYIREVVISNDSMQIYLWNDPGGKPSLSMSHIEDGNIFFVYEDGVSDKLIMVKKAEPQELIFEDENGMIYFLKEK